ncbi:MAG: oligosaccharide flippase family protein [Alphaproteobacteria bacterium]|nr:oligosaccharide flippase family protein [Alphaproteobacteria bacterium]
MKDISVSIAATGVIQVANVATGILAARLLLPEGRGELAEIMLWAGLLAEFGSLGLYDALLYRAATGAANPRSLFAAVSALSLTLSLILVAVAWVVLPIAFGAQQGELIYTAQVYTTVYLPAYFGALLLGGLFQGQLDMVTWNVVRCLVPLGYLASIAVLWATIGPMVGGFAAANVAAHLLAVAVGIALVIRAGWFSIAPQLAVMRGLFAYGIRVYVGDVLQALRLRLDQATVALWLSSSELGFYVVALTIANAPQIVSSTIAYVAFPKISQAGSEGARREVFGRYLRLSLAASVAIALALLVLVPWAIPLLFGAAFAPAVPICAVLLVGLVPYTLKLMYMQALKAWDHPLAVSRAEIAGLVLAAIALLALVPTYGLIGAATALVIAQLFTAFAMGYLFHSRSGAPVLAMLIPGPSDVALALDLVKGLRR